MSAIWSLLGVEEGKPYPLRRLLEHIPTIVDAKVRRVRTHVKKMFAGIPTANSPPRAGAFRVCQPVSVHVETSLRPAETEIGKWRAETGAAQSAYRGQNSKSLQTRDRGACV